MTILFIATAAFGSPFEKHVMLLKEFRDKFLLTNKPGKRFTELYYKYSPAMADKISESELLKVVTKIALIPLIATSFLLLKVSFWGTVALLSAVGFFGFFIRMKYKKRSA